MELFDFAYMPEFSDKIDLLVRMARPERWDFSSDVQSVPHQILVNYINHTFKRLYQLNKRCKESNVYMYEDASNLCFNTGLFTQNFEEIFAYFLKSTAGKPREWILSGFFKESSTELRQIKVLPKRARYFDNITDLIYDTQLELRVNIDHILDDDNNRKRIPEQYQTTPNLPMLFKGLALNYARIRIMENYKAAVPQFFNGNIQFLIPISLGDPRVVDLSLAVSRDGDVYSGRTCLTLDMAYNNARLIAKPETDWLVNQ